MIAAGREPMCTVPLAAALFVGKLSAAAVGLPVVGLLVVGCELPQAARNAMAAMAGRLRERTSRLRERNRMIILRRVVEDEVSLPQHPAGTERAALPPRTTRRRGPGGRTRPPGVIHREASPLRDSAGIAPASLGSAPSRADPGQAYLIAALW